MSYDDLDEYEAMLDSLPPACNEPCSECPWVRTATPGHLGPMTAERWLQIAHADGPIACHKTIKRVNDKREGDWNDPIMRQCKGSAIFRANVHKSPRNPKVAAGPVDRQLAFASNDEFREHHNSIAYEYRASRLGRVQRQVLQVMASTGQNHSIDDLARQWPGLEYSSVYGAVQRLARHSLVDVAGFDGRKRTYHITRKGISVEKYVTGDEDD